MKNTKMDFKIENTLKALQPVPPRDPVAAAHARANFLGQVSVMRHAANREQVTRPKSLIAGLFPVLPGWKRTLVLKPVIAVVLALILFLGGSAITAYAAQDSLPNQTLYGLKTWSEDAVLALTISPQARLDHDLEFSDRRVSEMAGLLSSGNPIPEIVAERLQNELQQAAELAAGLDDPLMRPQLEKIRLRAEIQLRTMDGLISQAPEPMQPVLLQTQARLREQIRLCDLGIMDPQGFKLLIRERMQNRESLEKGAPDPGDESPLPAGTPMPNGNGNGYGPGPANGPQDPSAAPMPGGSGNGPGPNQATVTPGLGESGQQTPTHTPQYGNATPGPTSPAGNGDGSGSDDSQLDGGSGQNGSGSHGSGSGNGQ